MEKRTKKKLAIWIPIVTVVASALIIGLVFSFISCGSTIAGFLNSLPIPPSYNPPIVTPTPDIPTYKNILTSDKVKDNFATGGIWENKTELTAQDFSNYDCVDNSAFDGISQEINSITLPGCICLNNEYNSIAWPKIDVINIDNNNSINNWIIKDNILFYGLIATSISDRTISSNLELNLNWIMIANNFYDEQVFKNVQSIEFTPLQNIGIISIGENAFLNCNKIKGGITSNSALMLVFANSAFKGSSISSLQLDFNNDAQTSIWAIGDYAFADCNSLSNIKINDDLNGIHDIGDNAFSLTNPIDNRNVVIECTGYVIGMSDNILEGTYNQLNLNITLGDDKNFSYWLSDITFANINVPINNFNFTGDRGFIHTDVGFSEEQYWRIFYPSSNPK